MATEALTNDKIEAALASMANDWRRYFRKDEAEISELVAMNRARMIERAANAAPLRRSPWAGRIPVNPNSTMNYAQQGIARFPL